MLKKIALIGIALLTLNSCVSKKVYQELETKFNNLRSSNLELLKEKDELLASKKGFETDLEELKKMVKGTWFDDDATFASMQKFGKTMTIC